MEVVPHEEIHLLIRVGAEVPYGVEGIGPFESSQQAYDSLHIGTPKAAEALQAKELQTQRGQKEL